MDAYPINSGEHTFVCVVASSSSAFEGDHASNDKSGGLDVGCGLQEVLFAAPELFLECCSVGPLLGCVVALPWTVFVCGSCSCNNNSVANDDTTNRLG